MSYRAPRDNGGSLFFKLPSDLQLPLYSSVRSYNTRDDSLERRVQRALLEDYTSSTFPKPYVPEQPRWRGWIEALRRAFGDLVKIAGGFSLGMLVTRWRE